MVQDFSHQLQETMINHDPNGNGAYQETTRESIPRAPRQQKWWSTQTFWAILERVFLWPKTFDLLLGRVSEVCVLHKSPAKLPWESQKMMFFKKDLICLYVYIYINIIYKYLPFSKRKQHARFRVPHRYLWEKNTAMLRWSQHAKTTKGLTYKKGWLLKSWS